MPREAPIRFPLELFNNSMSNQYVNAPGESQLSSGGAGHGLVSGDQDLASQKYPWSILDKNENKSTKPHLNFVVLEHIFLIDFR